MTAPKLTEAQRRRLEMFTEKLAELLGDTGDDGKVTYLTRDGGCVCLSLDVVERLVSVVQSSELTDAGRAALRGDS